MALAVGEHVEVRVMGQAQNQAIQNVFHYRVDIAPVGVVTIEDVAIGFQSMWQGVVCPLLHSDYHVVNYEVLRIAGAVFLPGQTAPNGKTRLDYDELHSEQGVALDQGTKATDPLPTFGAIGFRKSCGKTRDQGGQFIANAGLLSGGFRLGPIVEADTVAADGNSLTAGIVTAATGVETPIIDLIVDAPNGMLRLEVISLERNKLPRLAGAGVPTFATADVNALTINPLITTQVSRKARIRYG